MRENDIRSAELSDADSPPTSPRSRLDDRDAIAEGAWVPEADMRVLTDACSPFVIRGVTPDWLDFCGMHREEVLGRTLSIVSTGSAGARGMLGGPLASALAEAAASGQASQCVVIHRTRRGLSFRHFLRVEPQWSRTRVSALTVTTAAVEMLSPPPRGDRACPRAESPRPPTTPRGPSADANHRHRAPGSDSRSWH